MEAARGGFEAAADTRAGALCVDIDIAAVNRNDIRRAFAAAADTRAARTVIT